jgi:hypothetical protein
MAKPNCGCGAGCAAVAPPRDLRGGLERLHADYVAVTGLPLGGESFCCPLCLREVHAGCATRAHAPGRDFGGKVVTAICRACNSLLGHAFEAAFSRETRGWDGGRKVIIRPGRAAGPFYMSIRAERHGPGRRHYDLAPLGSKTARNRAIAEFNALGGLTPPSFLTDTFASPMKLNGAILSWVYLSWVGTMGYAFCLMPCLDRVRRSLLHGDIDDLGRAPVIRSYGLPENWGTGRSVIVVHDDRETTRMVSLGWEWEKVLALVPLAGDRTASIYDRSDVGADSQPPPQLRVVSAASVFPELVKWEPQPTALAVPVERGMLPILGVDRDTARSVLEKPLTPASQARHRPRKQSSRRDVDKVLVPPLPFGVTPEGWITVAEQEVARVSGHPATEDQLDALARMNRPGPKRISAGPAFDPVTRRHLEELYRYAVLGRDYRPTRDASNLVELAEFAIRRLPLAQRPNLEVMSVRMTSERPLVMSAHAVLRWKDAKHLIGPFFSGRTLALAMMDFARSIGPSRSELRVGARPYSRLPKVRVAA